MRLTERTLQPVSIHARVTAAGASGGRARALSSGGVNVRASVLPEGGEISARERGDVRADRLRLLVPEDTTVAAGDGVSVNGRMYIAACVNRWQAHLELICESAGAFVLTDTGGADDAGGSGGAS